MAQVRRLLLVTVACFSALGLAGANDGAIEGVGGSIKLMDEHPSVIMKSERVEIDLWRDRGEVECVFVFHNSGEATSVSTGFPEQGWGDVDVDRPSGFTSFQSWVDGQPVATKIQGLEKNFGGNQCWRRWRVKTVRFGRGQTRTVRVRYSARTGTVVSGHREFSYTVHTGASWKGPIGHAVVRMRLHGLPRYADIDATGNRPGGAWVWERRNFEPTSKDDVGVSFFPGYGRIRVNGGDPRLGIWPPLPVIKDRVVWLPLQAIVYWFNSSGFPTERDRAKVQVNGRIIEVRRGERTVRLNVGGRTMHVNGKRVALPGELYVRERRLIVPLAAVARALGARVWFDPKTGTTYVNTEDEHPTVG